MQTSLTSRLIKTREISSTTKFPVISRFMQWAKDQEENRILWIALSLTIHGCILAPLSIFAVLIAGNPLSLFMIVLASMGIALVTNLAAMPTKITVPVFFITAIVDVVISVACLLIALAG
jgi:hypothetical protein